MTAQQLNLVLFFITLAIMGFSAWLVFSAQKFGARLAKDSRKGKTHKISNKVKITNKKEI